MTDRLRAAAQAALEALEIGYDSAHSEASRYHAAMAGYKQAQHDAMDASVQQIAKAITDLRAALAEQEVEQEPVAWGIIASNTGRICRVELDAEEVGEYKPEHVVPLYTAPPRRSWVGLTDEERKQFAQWVHPDVLERVEYLLKEKNHD